MTALRRTTKIRGAPMRPLDLQTLCDRCGKSRAHDNHDKCSKARQAEMAELRAREKNHE
ncbi:hypothetical protein 8F9_5 [uncultured Caudovirales phage]|uniref:Uncharacterized protein n=1 Tax=uncultured Caudovirales phage TaxID=2100421 RepID=A0A2H4J6V8_9CAUD|nr:MULTISPECIES: hypothetical protein [unclassified Pseudomonas]ASN69918.1 hypothetical protein 7AX6_46 [uncultured Caudovirales phage]ASN70680.1 hypothetical protein 2AX5_50 [uncultured Caudovirales phage]ASN70688.1 hypothetical protein 9AX3_5 [uncultured Caudovirales phage]ASN70752.1 hypothetical protein 10AX4_16 [uncultured Caudovirales phage]ASN70789.1 hypothetical protein 9S2_3 [uncultured Caudovirales phage]